MSAWDDTIARMQPAAAQPAAQPAPQTAMSAWDATLARLAAAPGQEGGGSAVSGPAGVDQTLQDAVFNFTDAFGHNLMKPLHNAAKFINHGLAAGADLIDQTPQNLTSVVTGQRARAPWNQAFHDTMAADDAALAKGEADYQKSVPTNAASVVGAVTGGALPYAVSGLSALGEKAASLLPEAAPALLKAVTSGAVQGAAVAPTLDTNGPGAYGDQLRRNAIASTLVGGALPVVAAPIKAIGRALRPAVNPEGAVSDIAAGIVKPTPPAASVGAPGEIVPGSASATSQARQTPLLMPPPAPIGGAAQLVPGSVPTTAQAHPMPMLTQAEQSLRNSNPEVNALFLQREADNNAARLNVIRNLADPDGSKVEAAIKAREAATAPMRARVFANQVDAQPVLDKLDALTKSSLGTDPVVKAGARDLIAQIKESVQDSGGNGTMVNADLLDGIRQNASSFLQKYAPNGAVGTKQQAAIGPIKDAITLSIDAANPGYRDYLATYAKASQPINSMEAAQGILARVSGGGVDARGNPLLTLPKITSALNAARGSDYGLTPEADAALEAVRQDLQRANIPLATRGSPTAWNQASRGWLEKQLFGEDMSGGLLGAAAKVPFVPKGVGTFAKDRVQRALGEALLNPDVFQSRLAAAPQGPGPTAIGAALADPDKMRSLRTGQFNAARYGGAALTAALTPQPAAQ